MAEEVSTQDVETDPSLIVCIREMKMMLILWIIQSVVMVGFFLAFGYYRTDDPFGWPLGLPGWYLYGGVIPAIVFLFVVIYMVRNHFTEVDIK